MVKVYLVAGHKVHMDGVSAAGAIFSELNASKIQERESSNYVEGGYFVAESQGCSLTVSFGDSDEDDLPIWLFIDGPDDGTVSALLTTATKALKAAGFRLGRLVNFGSHDEQVVEI